jgi:hypothetical protein
MAWGASIMVRRRLLILSPALFAPVICPSRAWAQQALVGLWTVTLGSDPRQRHWQVQDAAGGSIRSLYGWPGETLGRVTASITSGPGPLRLRLVTGAQAVIEAVQTGPDRFSGTFTYPGPSGRTDTVTLSLAAPAAAATAPQGPSLLGLWTVMVEGEERHRSWIVRGVDGTAIRSKYGWQAQEPAEISGTVLPGSSGRTLRLATPAQSVIEAREEASGRFTGRIDYRNGRTLGVTLMQESGATAATAPAPASGARYIVYVGSPDCPFCHTFNTVHYRGEYERSAEGRRVPLRVVTAYSYRNNRLAGWPADLAGIPAQIRMEGVPLFLAVSGTTVVAQARGLSRFELDIRPLARQWAAQG